VTIVGPGARHDEYRPHDFTAQPVRVVAELSEMTGTFLLSGARRDAWLAVSRRAAVMAGAEGAYW
jgi:hypothetical protein